MYFIDEHGRKSSLIPDDFHKISYTVQIRKQIYSSHKANIICNSRHKVFNIEDSVSRGATGTVCINMKFSADIRFNSPIGVSDVGIFHIVPHLISFRKMGKSFGMFPKRLVPLKLKCPSFRMALKGTFRTVFV